MTVCLSYCSNHCLIQNHKLYSVLWYPAKCSTFIFFYSEQSEPLLSRPKYILQMRSASNVSYRILSCLHGNVRWTDITAHHTFMNKMCVPITVFCYSTCVVFTLQLASQNAASPQKRKSLCRCCWGFRDTTCKRAAASVTSLRWCKWRLTIN